MAVTLTWSGSTPGQPQFGLATWTEHYKVKNDDGSQIRAAAVMVDGGVPQIGDAHPDYAGMFCTDRHCAETGESASALDVIYMGILGDDLPLQQHTSNNAVQSSSSSYGTNGPTVPITVEFYAPTNVLTYISSGGPGTTEADDPSTDPIVRDITYNGVSFAGGVITDTAVASNFIFNTTSIINSTEIVAGQYWSNVATKTKSYVPWQFDIPAGPLLQLEAPGTGYSIGDTLTIAGGGGTAVIVLTNIGISNSVVNWTVSSNTCTTNAFAVGASGGSGTGAAFNIIIVT